MIKLGKLSDIYDFQYGKGNNNPDNGGVYPVYGSNGIIGGYDKFNSEDAPVIGHIGANAGSVVFAKGKHFVTYNGVICKIKDCADKMYGYYALLTSNLKQIAFGSAQPFVSYNSLDRIAVYLPPVETQQKISTILCSYDNLIENNNRRIALLEKAAQELYKEWFVRFRFPGYENAEFENGLPKGWVTKKLFDIANVKYGYAFKSDLFCEDETLNPVVRIRDIPNNKTNTFTSEECDEKYIINENAIVIGMDGIFHMCLWNGGKAFLNQRVVEIDSKTKYLCNLHLYYALYPQVKYWEQTISGTTVAHLGDKHLKKMTVLLPTEDICKKTNDILSDIMMQKNTLFQQNQNLIKQRDLLLPRLMSGKLEV